MKFRFSLFIVLLIGVSLVIGNLKLEIGIANAQIPSPTPIPCNDPGRDPEFHSLRPYQASPCKPDDLPPTAKFCGNELIFHDVISKTYPGGGTCVDDGTKITCTYKENVSKKLVINLSVANLPIMGNTEDVPNSQPATGTPLTDADKMNGYVSWYLNGVMGRAEDGNTKNSETKNIINFSGPINKLLPSAILDAQRIESINNAKVANHNQIVVCADPDNGGFWGGLLDVFGMGKFKAKPCYNGDGNPSSGKKVLRLENWKNDTLSFNAGANTAIKIWLAGLKLIYPDAADAIEKSVGNHWIYAKPPLPWDSGKGKAFKTEVEYQKAYQEWKGNVCVIIPLINKVVCINNIFVPSYYADLYSYVPLSSTEDLKGSVEIDKASSATNPSIDGVDLSGVSFDKQTPSTLFFSHMQESTDLADTLQNTFVGKSERGNKKGAPTNVSPPASCTTVDVRSNKGDKLFATDLTGTLNYTAEFSCVYNSNPTCSGTCVGTLGDCKAEGGGAGTGTCTNGGYCCKLPGSTPPPPTQQTCTKDIYISLSTTSSTPKVDDIWSQLVAGPQSIFKRIFPKTNTPGSVGQIKDMPGSTSINYQLEGLTQQTTDLKFPHIGSISEYFLKGIQTALRPKGYGEPISFDLTSSTTASISGNINCNQSAPESGFTKIMNKEKLYQLALNWVSGKKGNHVLECYNDTVYRSKQAGVNVAMTLALWLHESNASNYDLGYLQDFGAYWPSTYPGYTAQITEYLSRAKNSNIYYKGGSICKNRNDIKDDFQAWATVYKSGKCDPNEQGAKQFYTEMMTTIDWVSDCPTPTSPVDTSCP